VAGDWYPVLPLLRTVEEAQILLASVEMEMSEGLAVVVVEEDPEVRKYVAVGDTGCVDDLTESAFAM